jgi:hypothetical protein
VPAGTPATATASASTTPVGSAATPSGSSAFATPGSGGGGGATGDSGAAAADSPAVPAAPPAASSSGPGPSPPEIARLLEDARDNLFDELSVKRPSSWQYELRQLEINNRILADEVASLLANRKKRKRRKGTGNFARDCANCHTRNTPEWRRGPSGNRDLCNSCGLRWAKQMGRVSPRTSNRGGSGDSSSKRTTTAASVASRRSVASAANASNVAATTAARTASMAGALMTPSTSMTAATTTNADARTAGKTGAITAGGSSGSSNSSPEVGSSAGDDSDLDAGAAAAANGDGNGNGYDSTDSGGGDVVMSGSALGDADDETPTPADMLADGGAGESLPPLCQPDLDGGNSGGMTSIDEQRYDGGT